MSVKDTVVGFMSRSKFWASNHAPQIAMTLGTVELIGAVVTTYRATLKFKSTLDDYARRSETLDYIVKAKAEGTATPEEEARDVKHDRIGLKWAVAKSAVKHFWLPALLTASSAATYICGTKIVLKWFGDASALAASLMVEKRHLEEELEKNYGREAVRKVNGMSSDNAVVETHTDEETGEEVVDSVSYGDIASKFVFKFSPETCRAYEVHKNKSIEREVNISYLRKKEAWCGRKLWIEGHQYANDTLDEIGFDDDQKLDAGQFWGYISDGTISKVSFGLDSPLNDPFYKGESQDIYITLNVDPEPIVGRCGYKSIEG